MPKICVNTTFGLTSSTYLLDQKPLSDAPLFDIAPAPRSPKIIDFPTQSAINRGDIAAEISDRHWDLLTHDQLEEAIALAEEADDDIVKVEMVHYREDGTSKVGAYSFYRDPETGNLHFNPPAYLVDEIVQELWVDHRFADFGEFGLRQVYEILLQIGYQPWIIIRKIQLLAETRPDMMLPVESLDYIEA